jgi:pyruvate kinase
MEPRDNAHEFIHSALTSLLDKKRLTEEDRVVILAGNFGKQQGASFIEISSVKNLLGE